MLPFPLQSDLSWINAANNLRHVLALGKKEKKKRGQHPDLPSAAVSKAEPPSPGTAAGPETPAGSLRGAPEQNKHVPLCARKETRRGNFENKLSKFSPACFHLQPDTPEGKAVK